MAVPPSSPETLESNAADKADSGAVAGDATNPIDPSTAASSDGTDVPAPADPSDSNPNPSVQSASTAQALPSAPPPPVVPSFAPSFRPLTSPVVAQYPSVVQNPGFQLPMSQQPVVPPPGVSGGVGMMPSVVGGVAGVPPMGPGGMYQVGGGQVMGAMPMPYGQVQNGYMPLPGQAPMGIPHGMLRYPSPYPMYRPGFPPRPIPGVIPQMPRPPIPGIRGIPPAVNPLARPVAPNVAPTEKPQTTVWVGKIASTVDNEFLLSILKLCGPVKSWKRPQGPSDGTLKSFGFCEFESAEGVLRSLRLLNKLSIDGQELMLNINEATKNYLKQYVQKKTEREKLKEAEAAEAGKDKESAEIAEKVEPSAISAEDAKDSEDSENKEEEINDKFGIVTDEDHEADKDVVEKIKSLIEERLKNKPIAPPSKEQPPVDASAKSNSEVPSKLREGESNIDVTKNDATDEKNDDEISGNKPASENEKTEISSPDKARRHESRSRDRDRDRDRDQKGEKERELERFERERERERIRREREREFKTREAERLYKDRLKEWEARERDKEHQRQYEKERDKERERERRKDVMRQEEDGDYDDLRKRKRRSSALEEKKWKRQREKEEDLNDRLKEEEEIADAKRRALEEQQVKDVARSPKLMVPEIQDVVVMEEEESVEMGHAISDVAYNTSADSANTGDVSTRHDGVDDVIMSDVASSNLKQSSNAPARKLGFGLIGSGKRTTVPSVFHEEDDENVDDKKMRPLVPIDYSAEELQAVQANASGAQPNLAAAAEFAKRISGVNPKDDKADVEKERSRRSADKSNVRERDRNDNEGIRSKDENREKVNGKTSDRDKDREDKPKAESKKLLDAKQLIDMIPKTKEELFVFEINWDIYDQHQLHERMKPWISKKITEFLGEEEATLVDYIVKCFKEHVKASKMLELLQSILDDEAEMFVLKMWRMLIFEIKKVETGLSVKLKT